MKIITRLPDTTDFAPRSLQIIFETQEELDTFGAIFNFVPICIAAEKAGLDPDLIRQQVTALGGEHNRVFTVVADAIRKGVGR